MSDSYFKTADLESELSKLQAEMQEIKAQSLSLDLSRGKPSSEQLDLSMEMLNTVNSKSVVECENGLDCRNYGSLEGIPEARRLMAEIMETHPDNVIVGKNSSLTLMFDVMSHAMVDGLLGETPWKLLPKVKFLCPSPGYDRHFAMSEHFGMELITIPMNDDGPDMDMIEELVSSDETIKGIWCVPKYSNPTGAVYSDEVAKRFANLKPLAKDFRIFWDNAYCIHPLYPDSDDEILDIISECEKAGNPDMVYEFCSTSKITFAGGGIAAVAASPANLIDIKGFLKYSSIGPDKINQLRHARYFKNIAGVKAHMAKQADIMRPKFEAVLDILNEELGGLDIAEWTKPRGGYFISLDTLPGCADRVVSLCAEMGVVFTGAGATFPYGNDPKDSNLRIAPSYASTEEVKPATKIFTLAVKIASIEKLLSEKD